MSQKPTVKKLEEELLITTSMYSQLHKADTRKSIFNEIDSINTFKQKQTYSYSSNFREHSLSSAFVLREHYLKQLKTDIEDIIKSLPMIKKPRKLSELKLLKRNTTFVYEHCSEIYLNITAQKIKNSESFLVTSYLSAPAFHAEFEKLEDAKKYVFYIFNQIINSKSNTLLDDYLSSSAKNHSSQNTNSHNFKKGDIVFYPCSIDDKTKNLRCKVIDTTKESVHIESVEDLHSFKNWICHIQIINEKDVM